MTARKIEIEIPEADLEKMILEILNRRVQQALAGSRYLWAAEQKIQQTAVDLLSEMDLRELVRPKIQESIDHFLEDSVRHQVRNLVRLAVQREIAGEVTHGSLTIRAATIGQYPEILTSDGGLRPEPELMPICGDPSRDDGAL